MSTSGATHRRRTVQHTGYRRFARRCARVFATGLGLALLLVCGSAWAGKYNPVVGIAKQASLVRANNDGTYAVDFELRIQNSGREALIDVQILDELSRWIKPATVVGVSAVRVRGALSELRPGFDGVTENYLLSGNEELQPGEEAFVNFTLTFDANGQPGPFKNKAMAWVEGKKSGKEKDDFSQNGTDPDPDTPSERPEDNPNPDDHDDPTPFELPNDPSTDLKPAIGVAKRAEPTRALAAGEFPNIDTGAGLADPASVYPFVTTITLTIANVGDAPLIDVQLRDDLMLTFADAASFAVLGALSSTGPLTVNPGFDGLGDTALLAGTDALPVGGSGTVQFAVAFDPGSAPGPFFNVANGQAVPDLPPGTTGPTDPVDDDSDDGSDPDPDGDGDPSESGENDPTPIDVPAEGPAVIGLAKAARDVAALADGEFAVTIELTVENLGASLLQDVQVTDDLRDTFSAARSFRILEAPTATGGLPVNAGYDGASNIALLAPGARLAVGEQQRIRYRAAFDPGAAPGPFLNIAFAQGTSPGGEDTDDQSTDGDDPDPDGNGDPGDNGEDQPTPISTTESVQIGIAKQAGAVEAGATNGEFEVTFLLTVENLSNVPLLDVQVRDSLATTFAAASSWRLLQAPTATGNLPLNPGFNGDTDDALLVADSAVLQVGQSEQIELQVAFTPSESGQVFENIAVANGVSPLGTPTEDRSTDGLNPDPNGNGDPEEENPTVVGPPTGPSGPGALVGTVFLDRNHDDLLGEGEQPLSGWRVVLRDAAGTVVGETVTDASGNYRFDDLPAGDYTVSFLHPDTGVTWGQPAVTIEENETARVDLPVDPQGRIYDSLTRDLVPGASVRILNANNDAELPPSCLLPGQQDQIVGSDAMYRFDIIHGADSRCPSARTPYRIEVVAAPEPFIIAPSTRIPPQSTTLDALVCSVDTDSSAPCVVLPGTDAPTEGEPTGYFLTIAIAASDPTVVNNHIPLDRPIGDALASDLVTMQKRALTSTASVGDLVFFEVRLQNQTLGDLTDVSLRDDLPGGFALVPESVLLIDPGADGQVDSGDDAQTSVGIAGTDPVTFGPFTLPASATRILRYGLRVSAGVTEGAFINRITPLQAGKVIGADAQALVEIVSDAVFDNTTIIGKVFDDRDGDGWQDPAHATGLVVSGGPFDTPLTLPDLRGRRADSDPPALLRLDLPTGTWAQPIMLQSREGSRLTFTEDGTNANAPTGVLGRGQSGQQLALRIEQRDGARALVIENMGVVERGIPGVRLGTVAGLLIEADYRGRFHLADVATGSRNRGTNFILKLDTASLPDGSRLISENPRVLRLTTALMSRIDFAVQLPRGATVEQTSAPGEVLELVTRRQRAQLPPVNFDTGRVDIPGSYAESLRALLAQYSDRDNLRMTFVGHADPRGLRGRLRSRYGDNKGLSAARAAEVAQFARSALDVPDSMIGFEGRGATQPVAPNDGPLGWAANRRVEIELSWTEVKQQQFAVTDAATAPTIGTTEVPRDSVRDLPQLHYRSGIAQLDDALISTARRLLAEAGDTPVRLKLTAHTDSQGLSAAARQRFGDNQGLSQARADAAAAQLRDILQLPAAAVVAEGRGASQPIGDNATATGRAANRRLELQLTTRATEQLERRWITPLQESRTDYLANGGAIWATEQPLIVTPKLDVLASVDRWSEGDAV
ncbi:MAG: OmpA family protein, partial [Pseudomonadales bacterium]